jgi:hypothetical protein
MNTVRDFLIFEIRFVVEILVSLLLLITVTEVLLGPLLLTDFYLVKVVENLNNTTGFIILLITLGGYGWALEEQGNV